MVYVMYTSVGLYIHAFYLCCLCFYSVHITFMIVIVDSLDQAIFMWLFTCSINHYLCFRVPLFTMQDRTYVWYQEMWLFRRTYTHSVFLVILFSVWFLKNKVLKQRKYSAGLIQAFLCKVAALGYVYSPIILSSSWTDGVMQVILAY